MRPSYLAKIRERYGDALPDVARRCIPDRHPDVSRAAPDQVISTTAGVLVIFAGRVYLADEIDGETSACAG